MKQIAALLVFVAAMACSPDAAPPSADPTATPGQTTNPRGEELAQLVFAPGRVSCHDKKGDVRSEGSGDRTGPRAMPPRPAQRGSDLGGVSVERYEQGMTFVFGARSRIPSRVPLGARLQYSFTASDPRDPRNTASVSAILLHRRWMVEVRDRDAYQVLTSRPTIARDVLEIVLEVDEVPKPMRGRFRSHAFSEWAPAPDPMEDAEVYSDFCPDTGFPRFDGTST